MSNSFFLVGPFPRTCRLALQLKANDNNKYCLENEEIIYSDNEPESSGASDTENVLSRIMNVDSIQRVIGSIEDARNNIEVISFILPSFLKASERGKFLLCLF